MPLTENFFGILPGVSELPSRIFDSPLDARSFTAVPPAWRVEPRANIVGGTLAAVVTLPMAMGLGALAFAPLGADFATQGVLAGLYAAGFIGLVMIMMGARGVAIYAPRSLVAFMIASVVADVVVGAKWLPHDKQSMVAALFLLLALSGAFQLAFGMARLARVVKFIPTPVMAGFQNAAAITIVLTQIHVLLGLQSRPALRDWPAAWADARPLTLAVAAATLLVAFQGGRLTRRVPPLVLALVAGTALYYALELLGFGEMLGPTLGRIPSGLPDGHVFSDILGLTLLPGFQSALPTLVAGAASIGLVSSLDVLISAKIVENLSKRRGNATQELISVGAANIVTPILGGIGGSISLASTTTAMKGGARNSLALLVHALLFLILVPVFGSLLGHVPRVVVAALLVNAGVLLVDRWTLQLLRRVAARRSVHWPTIFVDLFVIVLVAAVALSGAIVAAVLIGVAVAVIVFTLRMSRGVIRREQYGDIVQSRRTRDSADAALLARDGRAILAIELEGPLFFGSAEALHNRVDAAIAEGVRYIVLDASRVTELDSTGARILLQAEEKLRGTPCRLMLSGAEARAELAALMADHDVTPSFAPGRMFPDLDRALEWCENDLLASQRGMVRSEEHAFERLDLVAGMEPNERDAVFAALQRCEYGAGETVFHQGDEGDALYIIARGSASVRLESRGAGDRRLMTFSQGTFFGEMALLDREKRSATIIADEPLVCYVLRRAAFETLALGHPLAGLQLLTNLSRQLSFRMRRANRTLLELG